MRSLKYILTIGAGLLLVACNDSFMDRYPQTSISEENFFQTPKDLETYTNGLYEILQYSTDDVFSDNVSTYGGSNEFDNLLRGKIDETNVGGWANDGDPKDVDGSHSDWGTLRKCNVLIANGYRAQGDVSEINHHMGIGRFFRAWFYFSQIKRYGSAPWYSKPLQTSDVDLLEKGQDSREMVVDSIMADLQFAVDNIKAIDSRTKINKWAALSLMSRIALYEGTFRKYHTELNLQGTATALLEKAVWATNEIMTNGGFEITGSGAEGYRNLFCVGDLSTNKEMILFADYDRVIGRSNNTSSVLDWQWHLSRSLADSYLKIDGTPISLDPSYAKRQFTQIFENRDPRMAETIMPAGFIGSGDTQAKKVNPTYGGLGQVKFYPRTQDLNGGYGKNYTDLPIFRYAEVLLINAEAKAELGTITQNDINNTINLLRNRVGVAVMDMNNLPNDPVIAAQYPDVKGANAKVILEIRRERRVEMACEGLRTDDIKRWNAGKLMETPSEGMYVPGFGPLDITGDGEADIAIFKTPADNNLSPEEKDKLTVYTLFDENGKEQGIYLSEGDKGYIRFVKDKNMPVTFISPKYYYFPIPFKQVQLNPNLEQPDGWR